MTQRRKRIGEDFVFKNWGEGEGGEAEICPNPEEKYTFINVRILEIKKKKNHVLKPHLCKQLALFV